MKLEQMTIEQLEALNQDLMNERAEIQIKQRALNAVLNDKRRQQAIAADIAAMKQRHGVDVEVTGAE